MAAVAPTLLGMVPVLDLRWTRLLFIFILLSVEHGRANNCGCHNGGVQGNQQYHESNSQTNSNEAFADSGGVPYHTPNSRILQFYPNYLDFREQYVGMPHAEPVTLFNPSNEYSIILNPRKPSSSFFYVSPYDVEEIPPLGNTTVKIVFVAYIPGSIESTVVFSTSRGSFNYQVFATGLPNPYRLRSFVGAKIPYNGSFAPYINMFNPYDQPLQIIEMYSSGGDLHLEPPQGGGDLTKDLWRIPPYETKAVMKVSYHGAKNLFYRGFVRVKCASPAADEEVVVLPIEVDVTDEPIVFTNVDAFDFGMLRTMDEPKILNLNLYNNGNTSVTISSISVVPKNKAVTIQHSSVIIKPCKKYTRAATITFSAYHVTQKKQSSGMIVIMFSSKAHQVLEIPYQATVLKGTMAYSVSRTTFFALDAITKPVTQVLTITNTFNFPLLIYNATLPATVSATFSILNFTKNLIVAPGKLVSPLSIRHTASSSEAMTTTTLRLYTNASIFTIPIHSYSGQVKYSVEGVEQNILEYGTVGTAENRTIIFKIINDNPVEVSIKEYNSNVEFVRLRLVHVQSFKKAKITRRNETAGERKNVAGRTTEDAEEKIVLHPKDVAVFSADMTAPAEEGSHSGEVKILTSFEEIRVPVYVKTVHGSLVSKPRRIHFQKMFPGKSESYALAFTSTFPHALAIKRIELVPPDPRFVLSWANDDYPTLPSNQKQVLGKIRFDPLVGPSDQCYICLCNPDPVCSQWLDSLALPVQTWEIDLDLLEKSKRIWDGLVASGDSNTNALLVVDTEIIRGYSVPLYASLSWPSIVEQSVQFPATHVSNVSIQKMTLTNPADVPVVVQVLPLHDYPHSQGSLDFLADRFEIDSFSIDANQDGIFFLHNIDKIAKSQRKDIHGKLGVWPSLGSYTTVLRPRASVDVMVGFKPNDERTETSVMVVRNNLTILDLVVVQGQGAKSEFTINERKSGTNSVLLFELKASHLADCAKTTAKARTFPSFTVKRTFTATNTGRLPIHVTSLNINDYECEGYGFRVLDCAPFVLPPNTSRKIDISFAPDFTTSRVVRSLRVVTTMEPLLEFTLLATLPRQLLSLCASALPRPFWAPYLHVIVALVMSSAFVVVIFLAYFDAQKYVLQCTFTFSRNKANSSGMYPMGTVFDLNAVVGANSRYDDRRNGDCKPSKCSAVTSTPDHETPFTLKNKLIDYGHVPRSRSSSSSSDCSNKSSTTTSSQTGGGDATNIRDKHDAEGNASSALARRRKTRPDFSKRQATGGASDSKETRTRKKSQQLDEDEMTPPHVDKPRIVYEDTVDAVQQEEERRNKIKKRSKATAGKKEIGKLLGTGKEYAIPKEMSVEPIVAGSYQQSSTSSRRTPLSMAPFYRSSYDKLDEISITGPKPDVTQFTNQYGKAATKQQRDTVSPVTDAKRKLNAHSQHSELTRALVDPPARPPAPSLYAVINQSLSTKHKRTTTESVKRKADSSVPVLPSDYREPSGPSSPASLGSFSSSDTSTKQDHARASIVGPRATPQTDDSTTPATRNQISDGWPFTKSSISNGSSSSSSPRCPPETSSAAKANRTATSDVFVWPTTSSNSGVIRRHSQLAPSSSDSMFFYDNLSSLRASKELGTLDRAPGSRSATKHSATNSAADAQRRAVIKSKLSADSAEFVPSSSKLAPIGSRPRTIGGCGPTFDELPSSRPSAVGSSLDVSSLWGDAVPSISASISPRSEGSTWPGVLGGELRDGRRQREPGTSLLSAFGQDSHFTSLLAGNISDDDDEESFTPGGLRGDRLKGGLLGDDTDMWGRADADDNADSSTDFGWPPPPRGLRRSIWSADVASTGGGSGVQNNVPRSLIGLDLSLPLRPVTSPVGSPSAVDRSPLSPFGSIWSSPREASIDIPYDGWMNDISTTTTAAATTTTATTEDN